MKNKIPSIVTVRTKSTRLPEKCLLDFGNKSLIEHIIDRCIATNLDPIICTTKETSDDKLIDIALAKKVKYFRGHTKNKLLRWYKCAENFNLKVFTTVDADDPFFCGEEVRRSFNYLIDNDLDLVIPYKSSTSGGAMLGYSFRTSIVKKALKNIPIETDTEMAWSFFTSLDSIKQKILSPPEDFEIHGRLTLDYYEDYIFLEALRLILGAKTKRRDIKNLLVKNPDLQKINFFRNVEWSQNQKNKEKNFS